MASRSTWVLPALFLAAGCIPNRDNVNDPTRIPETKVKVLDVRTVDGTCGDPLDTTPAIAYQDVTGSSSNSRCLALSAEGSEDPQHTELEYRFSYLTTNGRVFIGGTSTFEEPYAVAVPESDVTLLSSSFLTEFEVEARDEEGSIGVARVSFFKVNNRPVAVPSTFRSVPLGGHPWAFGAPVHLRFEGAGSYDPDGDAFEFCWTVDGVDQPCGAQTYAEADLPTDDRRTLLAELRLRDENGALSVSSRHLVVVREPQIWFSGRGTDFGNPTPFGGQYERVDTVEPASVTFGTLLLSAVRMASPTAVVLYSDALGDEFVTAVPLPEAAPTATPVVAENLVFDSLVSSLEGNFVWHVGKAPFEQEWVVQPYTVTTGSGLSRTVAAAGVPSTMPTDDGGVDRSAVTESGTLFMADAYKATIWQVEPGGTPAAISVSTSMAITSIGARPGTDEVWAVLSPVQPTQGVFEPARILLLSGGSGYEIPLPVDFASALAFVDGELVWIDLDGYGLVALDAELFLLTGSVELSLVSYIAAPGILDEPIVDRETGEYRAFVSDPVDYLSRTLVRAWPSGAFDAESYSVLYLGETMPALMDGGGAWFTVQGSPALSFSETISVSEVAADASIAPSFEFGQSGAADPFSGGLWVTRRVFDRPTLVHLDPNGNIDRTVIGLFDAAGDEISLRPRMLRASPDGETLWLLNWNEATFEDELLKADLTTPAYFPSLLVEPVSGIEPTAAVNTRVFDVSPPGLPEVVWSGTSFAGPPYIVNATTIGGDVESFFLGGFPLASAVTPSEGALCVTWNVPGTREFQLRAFWADGLVTDLGAETVLQSMVDSNPRAAVGTWSDEAGDYCWFALADIYREAWSLVVVRTDGTVVHRFPTIEFDGFVTSVAPLSIDSAWIGHDDDPNADFAYQTTRTRVDFDPAVGSSAATLSPASRTFEGELVSPFGSL